MTDLEIFQKVRPLIMMATGVPECILADPNIDAPSGAYASVRVSGSMDEHGQPITRKTNAANSQVTYDVRAQIIAEVVIDFYRGEALHFARRLRGAYRRPKVSAYMFQNNFGWNRLGAVNNLSTLQSAGVEQRANVSLFIRYEEYDPDLVETINVIEKVPYEVSELDNNGDDRELASGIIE